MQFFTCNFTTVYTEQRYTLKIYAQCVLVTIRASRFVHRLLRSEPNRLALSVAH